MSHDLQMLQASRTRTVLLLQSGPSTPSIRLDLERAGYEALSVLTRADAAQRVVERIGPEVVVFEVPGQDLEDRVKAAQLLRRTTHAALLWFCSKPSDELLKQLFAAALHGFLVPPCSAGQLRATMETAVALRQRELTASEPAGDNGSSARASRALERIGDVLSEWTVGPWTHGQPAVRRHVEGLDELSEREWDVLRLLLTSLRPAQIARELGISLNTVRNHLKSIYGKLDVHSQAELIDLVKGNTPA
ncbi:MAG: LuxR C-terminal-related transcriptional regulator [Sandaracinaceae bacterium]